MAVGRSGAISIRVRYAETDAMGLLHHANYLVYFEQARVELLRGSGRSYRDLEASGFFLVLSKVEVRYRKPARFDDLLTVQATLAKFSPVRLEHTYEVRRDTALLTEGSTTLACVDGEGKLAGLPNWFLETLQSEPSA